MFQTFLPLSVYTDGWILMNGWMSGWTVGKNMYIKSYYMCWFLNCGILHEIHPFKVYNQVAFSIFSLLCFITTLLISEHLITPQRNPQPLASQSLFSFTFQSSSTTNIFSPFMDLVLLNISCTWNHKIYGLLYLLFSLGRMLSRSIHIEHVSVYHSFLWCNNILWMNRLHFV